MRASVGDESWCAEGSRGGTRRGRKSDTRRTRAERRAPKRRPDPRNAIETFHRQTWRVSSSVSGSSQDKARTLRGDVLDGVPQVVQAPQQGGLRGLRELAARDALLQGLGLRGRGRRAAGRGDARARALRARAEDPPCAHPAPSAVARAFATAWGRARRWTRAGTAEATGAASGIMAAPVLTSRKHSRGVVWSVPTLESRHVNTSEPRESALLEIRDPNARKSDFHLTPANGTQSRAREGNRSRRRVR